MTVAHRMAKRKHDVVGGESIKRRKKFSKQVWTPEEDEKLRMAVERVNKTNTSMFWSKVAESLPGRVGRQCRDRWVNHLRPKVNKEVWTKDEDKLLFDAIQTHGTQWAEIARLKILPGRTDLSLKNRYYSCLRREERKGRSQTVSNAASRLPLRVKTDISVDDADQSTVEDSRSEYDSADDLSQHSDVIELSSILLCMQSSPVHRSDEVSKGGGTSKERHRPALITRFIEEQRKGKMAHGKGNVPPSISPTCSDTVFTYADTDSRLNAPFANALVEQVLEAFKQTKQEEKQPATVEEKSVPKTYANGRTVSGAYPGTENTGRWSHVEHEKFIQGMMKFGKNNWTAIANVVKTRTVVQVRTHAQKFYKRLKKTGSAEIDLNDLVQQRNVKVSV